MCVGLVGHFGLCWATFKVLPGLEPHRVTLQPCCASRGLAVAAGGGVTQAFLDFIK